jgi:hypothetical protein
MVFMPQCLRNKNCPARLTSEGIKCVECGQCVISTVKKKAEGLGYKFFIVPGGSFIRRIAREHRPKAIVGVACRPEVKEGLDIHAFTASLVFGIDEKDVTSEMRNMAKTVNFGIIYGMSPYGLSQSLKIDVDKAKDFIDAYFERYPDVKQYLEGLIEEAREKAGEVAGQSLKEQGYSTGLWQEQKLVAIKAPVFSMSKLIGVDTYLGPEMKSTGEVMGISGDFGEAFAKAQLGAGEKVPKSGTVFISVKNKDKKAIAVECPQKHLKKVVNVNLSYRNQPREKKKIYVKIKDYTQEKVSVIFHAGCRTASDKSLWKVAFPISGGLKDSGKKYDPEEYAHIQAFYSNPDKVWLMLKDMFTVVMTAKPNPAHLGLAELERMGLLSLVITQNVDGRAPTSHINVSRIGTTSNFNVAWGVTDDEGGSGSNT